MNQVPKIALPARLARIAATSAVSAAVLGPLMAKFGVLPPMTGFLLFALALPFSLLAILFGLVGMFATRKSTGKLGARSAWASAVVGLAIILIVGVLGQGSSDVPPIHDITTNTDDAPEFVALLNEEPNEGVDRSYPHGPEDTASQQLDAYPDLKTSHLLRTPAETLEIAKTAATELGWTIVAANEPESHGEPAAMIVAPSVEEATAGAESDPSAEAETYQPPQPVEATMEATSSSNTFRFVDDIVVRIRGPEGADAAHSKVDIRSTSRDGQSDLGANAARIRAFQELLEAAVAN